MSYNILFCAINHELLHLNFMMPQKQLNFNILKFYFLIFDTIITLLFFLVYDIISLRKVRTYKAAYPLFSEGLPSRRKKGGRCQWLHIRNYSNFVHSLLLLLDCVTQSSRKENSRPLLAIVNGC